MLGRIIWNKYGMLILGVVLLGVGFYQMNKTDVTCGSEVMVEGDICEETRKGRTTTNTFQEQKDEQALMSKVFTGAGGALTVGGIVWFVVAAKRGKQEQEADEPAPFPTASV